MGISNEQQLNKVLGDALVKGKETKRFNNEYGTTICRRISIEDKGSVEVIFLIGMGT